MAVYTLVGAEPIAITLDKNVLTFFMNIVRNSGTIECEILRRQIVFSDQRGKDFINRVEKTLSKYNLKSSSYYIENPLNKIEWKRLVGIKIKEYWKNECHNEKMEKTSLKYIEIQNNPLNEAHNIWKSVKNNSKDVKAGEIKARISTQTYIFQAKRAKFDPKVDEFLKKKGHEVLRLPSYHCEFNPIELIWGNLKGFVGQENSTFKQNDVKSLIQKGFEQINSTTWFNSCNHVKNNIEPKYWQKDAIQDEIQKIIIHIESDSEIESESENDDLSDGDETEDYEWP
ncbi:unnamed protein product [Mytilus edulis]|uniref:Tc1-like transposase DDE domain-containing protein n=1 Tax=Mytilus edulis TaxID=6550 RepID=A0A8S3RB28_MYTED|nr:unnamed protein product [Mytilus edulis]